MKKLAFLLLFLLIPSIVSASDIIRKFDQKSNEAVFYCNGREIARQKFIKNGDEFEIKETVGQIPDGIVKEVDEFGSVIANYKNNKLEGELKEYDGAGALISVATYKNSKLESIYKKYYATGQLENEANYKNGKLDGISKWYDFDGKLTAVENYKAGKLEGLRRDYYENGKSEFEVNFKEDKAEGVGKYYYRDGSVHVEEDVKNGVILEGKEYDRNGKIIKVYKERETPPTYYDYGTDEEKKTTFGKTAGSQNNTYINSELKIKITGPQGWYMFKMEVPFRDPATQTEKGKAINIIFSPDEINFMSSSSQGITFQGRPLPKSKSMQSIEAEVDSEIEIMKTNLLYKIIESPQKINVGNRGWLHYVVVGKGQKMATYTCADLKNKMIYSFVAVFDEGKFDEYKQYIKNTLDSIEIGD
jgi:antitoxin component YwqK of YwqJK toxin-antitoxin module